MTVNTVDCMVIRKPLICVTFAQTYRRKITDKYYVSFIGLGLGLSLNDVILETKALPFALH